MDQEQIRQIASAAERARVDLVTAVEKAAGATMAQLNSGEVAPNITSGAAIGLIALTVAHSANMAAMIEGLAKALVD